MTRYRVSSSGTIGASPARVLVESDPDGSNATTFAIDPGDGGGSTHLTITTEIVARPGVLRFVERLLTSMTLRRVYRKELARLAGQHRYEPQPGPGPFWTLPAPCQDSRSLATMPVTR
jgi:hypothetical protein